MKIEAKTREEYFKAAGEREEALRKVDEIIKSAAPDLKPFMLSGMSLNMLAYGPFHYRYKSGREGDWAVIALANQKNYMSLYVCVAKDNKYLAELYKDRLGKVSVGKSCIRFKKLEDLNLESVNEMLSNAQRLAKSDKNFMM